MDRIAVSPGENSRYRVRGVLRALDVLIALGQTDQPKSLTNLSREVGLHPTTTLRMLESLRARGFAQQTANGTFELGVRPLELASRYLRRMSISKYAQEAATKLAREVKETASIGSLVNGEVLYVAIADGQRELGIQSTPLARHPVHCTALGKVLMAYRPWQEVMEILAAHPPMRHTANTISEEDDLRQEFKHVAERGFAIANEERIEGVVCIAAPIRDHTDEVIAAISISGPTFRIYNRGIEDISAIVVDHAESTSRLLGATQRHGECSSHQEPMAMG